MKIYKLIQTHEAKEGDLFICTGARDFFAREDVNNNRALEYKPEKLGSYRDLIFKRLYSSSTATAPMRLKSNQPPQGGDCVLRVSK